MILLSINFVLLTMLKVRKEQIHFWLCWCFPPTGPIHLISALSLWAGTLRAKLEGVLQLPDSTKWRTWTYEHKHTEQDATNTAPQTAGQTENMGDTVSEVQMSRPTPNQMMHLKDEHGWPWCSKHRVHNQRILFPEALCNFGSSVNIMPRIGH